MLAKWFTSFQESVAAQNLPWTLVSVVITAVAALYFIYAIACGDFFPTAGARGGKGRGVADALLILGECNSGKTRLFYLLQGVHRLDTVSSLQQNSVLFGDLSEKSALADLRVDPKIEMVDFPGHRRLAQHLQPLLSRAWRVIYAVDSTDMGSIRASAEQLYHLLVTFDSAQKEVPILIAATKSDLPTSKSINFVIDSLERELDRIRDSRNTSSDESAPEYLGIEGKPFRFCDAPVPVSVCAVSLEAAVPSAIRDFIGEGAKASG